MAVKKWLVDPETGEEFLVYLVGRSPSLDKGYVKVFTAFLRDVVEDPKIAGKAIRLLLYMIDRLDWNTLEVWIAPERAMQELGISEKTYYNWLKILLERGYIKKVRPNLYRLRPYSVIKGSMHKVSDEERMDFG